MTAKIFLDPFWIHAIYGTIAFVMGASIGSFLNVVIYRVPRDMSVGKPKRSFCPSCEKQLPFYLNIPLVSWVMLRGKCRFCGKAIAVRYLVVELVTALFFLAVWLAFPIPQIALSYWILVSLLLAATFIDLEHYIIPDEITIGGTVVGLVCATLVPNLMGVSSFLYGFGYAVLGACAGYVSLWAIVHLGKLAFGKVRETFDEPQDWSISQPDGEEEPELALGAERTTWSEFFFRPTDKIVLPSTKLKIIGKQETKEFDDVTAQVFYNRIEAGSESVMLEEVDRVEGVATEVTIPREAMGFGDVKFMAMIGAFLGWQAVLFTILAGSLSGAVVGILARVTGKQEWGSKIPFGPFLALGAVVWLFFGPGIVSWYLGRLG